MIISHIIIMTIACLSDRTCAMAPLTLRVNLGSGPLRVPGPWCKLDLGLYSVLLGICRGCRGALCVRGATLQRLGASCLLVHQYYLRTGREARRSKH